MPSAITCGRSASAAPPRSNQSSGTTCTPGTSRARSTRRAPRSLRTSTATERTTQRDLVGWKVPAWYRKGFDDEKIDEAEAAEKKAKGTKAAKKAAKKVGLLN